MTMTARIAALALAASLLGFAAPVGASTLGDTVSSAIYFPDLGAVGFAGPTFIVAEGFVGTQAGPGPILLQESYSRSDGLENYSFLPNASVVSFASATFNGIVLTDLSGAHFGKIVSVTGVPFANVISTGDTLRINLSGRDIGTDFVIPRLSVTLESAVPEPGAWALMLLGFGGLGGALRHRRARALLAG